MEIKKGSLHDLGIFYAKRLSPIFLAWLILVVWRPFFFGFYHDDWFSVTMPLEKNALFFNLQRDPTRPLYVFILFCMRSLFTDNAFLWQTALSLLQLTCAICLAKASTNLFGWLINSKTDGFSWSGVATGVMWLVLPWSLSFSAWPIMLPPLLSVVMATVAIIFATKNDARSKDKIISIILFCLGWLIYEATWFIWFPIASILILKDFNEKKNLQISLKYFFAAAFFQLTFIGLNRFISSQVQFAKRMTPSIFPIMSTSVHLLKTQLIPMLGPSLYLICLGIAILILLALRNSLKRRITFYTSLSLLFLLSGLALSIILYAFAGYAIEWDGLFGRVTLSLSFWIVLMISLLFGISWYQSSTLFKVISLAAILLVCLPLSTVLLKKSELWSLSWKEQKEILNAIKEPVLKLVGDDTLILMDVPRGAAPIHTFSAFWDISGALVTKIKTLVREKRNHAYASVLRPGEWRTTWDGRFIRQYWCTSPDSQLWELNAGQVYLWKYPDEKATMVKAPYDSGCKKL